MILRNLKTATQSQHDALEQDLDLSDRRLTREEYRVLLQMFYGFYQPLEDALAQSEPRLLSAVEFASRRKTPLLQADLRALGESSAEMAALPRCVALPGICGLGGALGCLYVLEGATLGGQALLKQWRAQGSVPITCAFFNSYGAEVGVFWKTFRQTLVDLVQTPADEDAAIEAARQTFACLHRWVSDTSKGQWA